MKSRASMLTNVSRGENAAATAQSNHCVFLSPAGYVISSILLPTLASPPDIPEPPQSRLTRHSCTVSPKSKLSAHQ
ncbi:hypothetical protein E2C01_059034 [Portunus trituberculatus]|uniref:Uncharacterized protein n=1 Tax=Portunus trituberculatus TaxID=210409 RepID=A0A5B7H1F6_PORTR|nr:hypothetical protein [Portunus trituberculatus]